MSKLFATISTRSSLMLICSRRCSGTPDPEKAKEITIKLTARLRKHAGNPKYKALAERLEDLKNRHQQGLLVSIDFLKELLELAKDVVRLERETPVEEEIDRGKAALTELFEEARTVTRRSWSSGWSTTSTRSCGRSALTVGRTPTPGSAR